MELKPLGRHRVALSAPGGQFDRDFVILWPDWLLKILSDLNFGLPGEYFIDALTATSEVQGSSRIVG